MKIASFEKDGYRGNGIIQQDQLFDLGEGRELRRLLELDVRNRESLIHRLSSFRTFNLSEVRLTCPQLGNRKILGIGMNYTSFLKEAKAVGMHVPDDPIWFSRPHECLIGPGDDIWIPDECTDLDYEGELVCVIGHRCERVRREEAPHVIGGFTIGNDVTMRRRALKSAVLGKSYATHAPIGPMIVTPDEIDPHELHLTTLVNGEERQSSSTSDMMLDCYGIIEALSSSMILEVGDLIFTGTPAGCGATRSPPAMLKAGDRIVVTISGIGSLENAVVHSPTTSSDR